MLISTKVCVKSDEDKPKLTRFWTILVVLYYKINVIAFLPETIDI